MLGAAERPVGDTDQGGREMEAAPGRTAGPENSQALHLSPVIPVNGPCPTLQDSPCPTDSVSTSLVAVTSKTP